MSFWQNASSWCVFVLRSHDVNLPRANDSFGWCLKSSSLWNESTHTIVLWITLKFEILTRFSAPNRHAKRIVDVESPLVVKPHQEKTPTPTNKLSLLVLLAAPSLRIYFSKSLASVTSKRTRFSSCFGSPLCATGSSKNNHPSILIRKIE